MEQIQIGSVNVEELAKKLKQIKPLVENRYGESTQCLFTQSGLLVSHMSHTEITFTLPSLVLTTDELVCVHYKDLLSLVMTLSGDCQMSITADDLYIGESFHIPLRDALTVPYLVLGEEETPAFTLPACLPTLVGMSYTDTSRPHLCGVGLCFTDQFIGVSNGHYLLGQPFAYPPCREEETTTAAKGRANATLPVTALKVLKNEGPVSAQLFSRVNANGDVLNQCVQLVTEKCTIITDTSGEFPNITPLRKTDMTGYRDVKFDRNAALLITEACLKAWKALKDQKAPLGLQLTGTDTGFTCTFTTKNGTITGTLPTEGATGITFGINMLYFRELLTTQGPTVLLSCLMEDGKTSVEMPMFLRGSALEAIVMPTRIF